MNDNNNDNNSSSKLAGILGYDPAKSHKLTKDLFGDVLKEIETERVEEAKKKSKALLIEAIALRTQMDKLKKEFDKQYVKSEKDLGKILNSITNLMEGKTQEEPVEESK